MTDGADADLNALHSNHRTFWRHMTRACGGTVQELPGGLLIDTGVPDALYNQLHCTVGPEVGAALRHASQHFARRGLGWRVVCDRPSPAASTFCAARGVEAQPSSPILRLTIRSATPGVRPGPYDAQPALSLVVAADLADLRRFVDCAAAGYQIDPALLRPLVDRRTLGDPGFRFHLGSVDGRCVAVSVSVVDGDTVGVYFVAVRRGFRRRGFGRAITRAAIAEGAAHGVRTAVLQATDQGMPVYLGMGFRHVGDYLLWDLPAAPAGGQVT